MFSQAVSDQHLHIHAGQKLWKSFKGCSPQYLDLVAELDDDNLKGRNLFVTWSVAIRDIAARELLPPYCVYIKHGGLTL